VKKASDVVGAATCISTSLWPSFPIDCRTISGSKARVGRAEKIECTGNGRVQNMHGDTFHANAKRISIIRFIPVGEVQTII
jgi:hypothetical protein